METQKKEQTPSHIHHGHNVKRLRNMALLSQKQLGERAGFTQQAVCHYEQKEKLDEDILQRLAKGLGVSVDLLNEMEDEKPLAFYIENNTFGNSNFTGNFINTLENPEDNALKMALEKLENAYQSKQKQYEISLDAYKQMVELLKKENQELKEKLLSATTIEK